MINFILTLCIATYGIQITYLHFSKIMTPKKVMPKKRIVQSLLRATVGIRGLNLYDNISEDNKMTVVE